MRRWRCHGSRGRGGIADGGSRCGDALYVSDNQIDGAFLFFRPARDVDLVVV